MRSQSSYLRNTGPSSSSADPHNDVPSSLKTQAKANESGTASSGKGRRVEYKSPYAHPLADVLMNR